MAACPVMWVPACDRETTPLLQATLAPEGEPMSLRQTYDRLREWYASRSYLAMWSYVDPARRDELMDLLMAMDELLSANAATLRSIQASCPGIDARAFDLSSVADHLGLFSRRIEVIEEQAGAQVGVLTVQVAGRLPLVPLEFRKEDGRWVYDPGTTLPEMTNIIRQMADAMNRVAFVVSMGPRTREEIGEEFRCRISPKLEQISALHPPPDATR
jgi:hypothetical protein